MTRSRPITFLASAAVIPLSRSGRRGLRRWRHRHRVATAGAVEDHDHTRPDGDRPGCEQPPGTDPGRLHRPHPVPVQGRLGHDQRVLGRVRGRVAATATGGKPAVAGGANAALSSARLLRSDGGRQVTYNGHPLYLFVKDHKPGDINGQGLTAFGAAWFAVSPAGNQISSHATGHGGGSSSSRPAAPAAPPAAKPQPAPKPAPQPAPKSVPKPPPPVAKPAPPANGIPQNNGGDGDSDNNGGPSDGDGNV